jgi:hypothetical protein
MKFADEALDNHNDRGIVPATACQNERTHLALRRSDEAMKGYPEIIPSSIPSFMRP